MSNLVPLLIHANGQVVVQGLEVSNGQAFIPTTINQTIIEQHVHPAIETRVETRYETRVERIVERLVPQAPAPVAPQRMQALPPSRPGNASKAPKPAPVAAVSQKLEPDPRFANVRTLEAAMKLLGRGEKLDAWEAMKINDRMIEDGWAG